MENHHFQWINPLFLWPFTIAVCKSLPEGISWGVKARTSPIFEHCRLGIILILLPPFVLALGLQWHGNCCRLRYRRASKNLIMTTHWRRRPTRWYPYSQTIWLASSIARVYQYVWCVFSGHGINTDHCGGGHHLELRKYCTPVQLAYLQAKILGWTILRFSGVLTQGWQNGRIYINRMPNERPTREYGGSLGFLVGYESSTQICKNGLRLKT